MIIYPPSRMQRKRTPKASSRLPNNLHYLPPNSSKATRPPTPMPPQPPRPMLPHHNTLPLLRWAEVVGTKAEEVAVVPANEQVNAPSKLPIKVPSTSTSQLLQQLQPEPSNLTVLPPANNNNVAIGVSNLTRSNTIITGGHATPVDSTLTTRATSAPTESLIIKTTSPVRTTKSTREWDGRSAAKECTRINSPPCERPAQ
mmetsp:Transcript_8447/g.13937  ORF Transcript_8447/g.13937 Transcript_8447/m.13937 type:complete len:200 (-) Transcript_8447:144-743(-)